MRSSLLARLLPYLFVLATAALAGCGLLSDKEDETIGWSAQKLYTEAKEAMSSKDWEKAVKYFEKLEARYPYGRYAQQAQLEIAYCHWKDNERALAIAAADRFIKMYPNHASVDYAWYLKGLINFNDNDGLTSYFAGGDLSDRDPRAAREAFIAFRELVTRFPQSSYAADAAARMRYLHNAMAMNEVHVARYYMKRGAFLAAANRAQYTIKLYPHAPAVEEAVYLMVRAYDALGMNDLRDAAERVMRSNYPQSRYLKGDKLRPDVPWWRVWDSDW